MSAPLKPVASRSAARKSNVAPVLFPLHGALPVAANDNAIAFRSLRAANDNLGFDIIADDISAANILALIFAIAEQNCRS